VELDKYGGKLTIASRKFVQPEKGKVAIKVMCTTFHPVDEIFDQGNYGFIRPKVLPVVPGFEGSGEIVAIGEGVDSKLKGKRCSFSTNACVEGKFEGAWAQYYYADASAVLVFEGNVDYEKIAFAYINPLTAAGFVDTVKKRGEKVAAQNAGNSTVGKIFIRLCQKEGIKSISIVRKAEHIESLKKLGADYVFSTTDKNWKTEFQKVALELKLRTFFECVGDDTTGTILGLLPPLSTLFNYGNLQGKPISNIDTNDLTFHRKKIRRMVAWTLDF